MNILKKQNLLGIRTGGDPITQGNRNTLLYKNIGVDGIKTGHLAVEEYSLASSIKKNTRRLIAVGSGFKTNSLRASQSRKLLTWGLQILKHLKYLKKMKQFLKLKHGLVKEIVTGIQKKMFTLL